jgi:hypothetical protein
MEPEPVVFESSRLFNSLYWCVCTVAAVAAVAGAIRSLRDLRVGNFT